MTKKEKLIEFREWLIFFAVLCAIAKLCLFW